MACAHVPPPSRPAPHPSEPPEPGPAETVTDDPATKTRADAAVVELAERLGAVERTCTERWTDDEAACSAEAFVQIAERYQACFSTQRDPHEFDGRFDTLPRLGGPGFSTEKVV